MRHKNFTIEELKCKDGTPVPPELLDNANRLLDNLQVLRDYIGEAVFLNSGYRTPSYNKKVGGAKNSQHLKATAGDITARGKTPRQLYNIILKLIKEGKMHDGGVGLYPGFVHYDVRPKPARW